MMKKENWNPSGSKCGLGTLVIGKNAMLFSVKGSHLMQVSLREMTSGLFKIELKNLVSICILPI